MERQVVETFQAEGIEEWEGACSVAVEFRKHAAKNLKSHALLSSADRPTVVAGTNNCLPLASSSF